MTALYGRKFSLKVAADSDGHALDLSLLRVAFIVRQWETQTPATLDIRIYNVTNETAARVGTEFKRIILQAGYEGQFGTIFDGTITQVRRGRESPADTFIDVTAADGDRAHTFSVIAETVAAGATPSDIHGRLCTAMNPQGVTAGYTPDLPGPALPRGRVLYGLARDHLRDLADATGCVWSIQNGQVVFMPLVTGYLPGEAVVLTSETGLIGLPLQTQDGIMVRCLLNPLLKVLSRIQIANASVQRARIEPLMPLADGTPVHNPAEDLLPKIDKDGFYRILAIDHSGDTRQNQWYSDIACISVDPTTFVPLSQVQRGRTGMAEPVPAPLPAAAPATTPTPPAPTSPPTPPPITQPTPLPPQGP